MLGELLNPLGRPLTHWLHIHHRSEPLDDCDGACPVCDFPFGEMNHMCIGGPSTAARDRSAQRPNSRSAALHHCSADNGAPLGSCWRLT
jgi:hypothetical protein